MSAIINFFKNRHLERIDYADLYAHFDEMPNCEVTSDDEQVTMLYHDEQFDFSYPFYITKRSRVNSIYNISAQYVNIRFLVEIPEILPEQVSRQVLSVVDSICRKFDLVVYYEGAEDAEEFDMIKMMNYLKNVRQAYIENNENCEYYTLPRESISHLTNYQQVIPFLKEKIQEDVVMPKYRILGKEDSKDAYLAIDWKLGTQILLPPNLDFINIIDDYEEKLLPINIFLKHTERYMYELKNYLPDKQLLLLINKGVKKAGGKMRRFKKHFVENNFKEIKIYNLIEK